MKGGKHHDHDYQPLNEAFEKYKQEMTSSLEPMAESISEGPSGDHPGPASQLSLFHEGECENRYSGRSADDKVKCNRTSEGTECSISSMFPQA